MRHRRKPGQRPDHGVVSSAPCTRAGRPDWGQREALKPLPSPQSDPRPNQTFPAPKLGLPTARNSSGSSQGPRAPFLCREVPPNSTTPQAKDWTERPSSWAWGIPWGPWPCEGARPQSANTTDPQLEGGLSYPKNPAWVKLPSVPVLGGLQEALGLGRTRPENWELGAVIWAAVYARRAQQTFTTLPPARGLTRAPHPSRTRELGAGWRGWGEPGWSRAQARQDRVTRKGADGLRGPGSHPQVEGMRPQVAEASGCTDGECRGPHQEAPGPGGRPRLLQPVQALHSWEHSAQRRGVGWSPGNTLERVEVTVPTFCPGRGTRPTLAQAASQARRALARGARGAPAANASSALAITTVCLP